MKKKLLLILIALMCSVFGLIGCDMGTYIENGGKPTGSIIEPGGPDTPGPGPGTDPDPDDPDKPKPPVVTKDYTATVYLNMKPFNPGDNEITVVWQNGNDVHRVPLGADGKANAGELDGDYGVYLVGLPSTYTYDPNAYTATADDRIVDIELTTLRVPSGGTGNDLYAPGCYTTRYDGTYRAEIKKDGDKVYYEYSPTSSGVYSVVSWVNVYMDEIDPSVDVYRGTFAFKFIDRTVKDGGAELNGGFTKNFRFECLLDASEIGSVFTFAVSARSKTAEYPVYVDFAIAYEGEYKNGYSDVRPQKAEEANVKAANANGKTFIPADLNTKTFDADNFKYNDNTGFYHYYSMELFGDDPYGNGAGYGPELYCSLTPSIPSYTITTLYNANSVGTNNSNYLMLYNVWLEDENKFCTYDYTDFIRKDYYAVRNSDGRCYVTEELRIFLQKFAENHSLYTDGVGPGSGTPEALGYSANQDALWLFACGFYM